MAAGHLALIGFVLVLLPACSTCSERQESAPPEEPHELIVSTSADGAGEVRRVDGGFELDLSIGLSSPERGIVLLWAGDFEGRPPRDQPATFDTREPVGFPWRPGTRVFVPTCALHDGALDLYVLVIAAAETDVYEVCEDRVAIPIPEDAARVPFDLDPRPLDWEDLDRPEAR